MACGFMYNSAWCGLSLGREETLILCGGEWRLEEGAGRLEEKRGEGSGLSSSL